MIRNEIKDGIGGSSDIEKRVAISSLIVYVGAICFSIPICGCDADHPPSRDLL